MDIMITGANGFAGRYLSCELRSAGHTVLATDINAADGGAELDVTSLEDIAGLLRRYRPQGCIHLAAMAFVPRSWEDAAETCRVNIIGTLRVLDAWREFDRTARVLVVSTSQIYGAGDRSAAITEDEPSRPRNPYAASKAAAEQVALQYARHFSQNITVARPDNHTGPGQDPHFVCSSFARQLAEIRTGGRRPGLAVGNLDSLRDFSDVRDVVRAYRLLLEKGRGGEAYNVASGVRRPVSAVLDDLCAISGLQPEITVDPDLYRPTTALPRLDTAKLRRETGWEPNITIEQTLEELYRYWLKRLQK